MPSTIFSGSKVKTLKDTLNLNGGADVISSTTDPTSAAVNAAAGSLLLNTTSGKLYRKNDAGSTTNWTEVGAGGTGKNYITQGTFDNAATTGWSLASSTLDATSKLPNQASGSWGAAAGTLAISTVGAGSQLAGNYSLSLASSAASTAGNMLVSDALTLDLEAQASIQTFSFFYKIASGSANINLSGTSSNSIGVAIYDVTNGAWIDPAGRYNIVQSSGVGKASGTFQVPANCTSVRLAVYFPNASTGAFTVYLDDFVLGPQVVQYGAPVTDWQPYTISVTANTTNPTLGTVLGNTAYYRRVGDSLQIRWAFRQTSGGTAGSGDYLFSLPPGFAIDTSKTTLQGASVPNTFGVATISNSTPSAVYTVGVRNGFPDKFILMDLSANIWFSGGTYNFSNANLAIGVEAQFPIAGLSSSVQMSNDTDTRVVAASISKSAAQTFASTSVTQVQFDSVNFDTHSAFNVGAFTYTVPVSGKYQHSGVISLAASIGTGESDVRLYKNGSQIKLNATGKTGTASVSLNSFFSFEDDAKTGDVYTIYTQQSTGGALNIRRNADAQDITVWNIQRLSGPATIAASETVAASYWLPAIQTSDSSTPLNFSSREFDSHSAVTTGAAWKFTAPTSGTYLVGGHFHLSSLVLNTLFLHKNGSVYKALGYCNGSTYQSYGLLEIKLNAGDYIDVRASASTSWVGYASLGSGTFGASHIDIVRVGN